MYKSATQEYRGRAQSHAKWTRVRSVTEIVLWLSLKQKMPLGAITVDRIVLASACTQELLRQK